MSDENAIEDEYRTYTVELDNPVDAFFAKIIDNPWTVDEAVAALSDEEATLYTQFDMLEAFAKTTGESLAEVSRWSLHRVIEEQIKIAAIKALYLVRRQAETAPERLVMPYFTITPLNDNGEVAS